MDTFYETAWGIFEWDDEKNEKNKRKHGVDFVLAAEVFKDDHVLLRYDVDHVGEEERYIAIGMVRDFVVLAVVHTERGRATRIISARRAEKIERQDYDDNFC